MFAYIQNNNISFLSTEKLDKDFLPDAEKYQVVEYDNTITDPIYNAKTQKIDQKKYEETRDEKFARVYKKLLELPELNATTDTSILEGIEFTDKEKGDLIVDRVFEGNPHGQSAMFANLLSGRKDADFMLWVAHSQQLTSHILEFFKMDGIGEKEREEAKERTKKEIEMMKLTPAKQFEKQTEKQSEKQSEK